MLASGRSTSVVRAASTITSMLRWASARRRRGWGVASSAGPITDNLRLDPNLDNLSDLANPYEMSENLERRADRAAVPPARPAGQSAPLGRPRYGVDAP